VQSWKLGLILRPQASRMPASVRGPLPLGEQSAQSEAHHEAPSV
jgi:hypothetical protein